MAISDYLLNYPQAPKLKTNYAANALQNLQQSGNPFAGIAGALLSPFAAKTDRETKRSVQSRVGKGRAVYQYVGITGNELVELVMCRRRRRGREIEFHPCLEKIVCTSCFSFCCLLQTV